MQYLIILRPDTKPLNPKLMNRSVKTLALITISLFVFNVGSAQLKLNSGSSVATDVKKVIEDYPNNFSNLIGDVIIQNPQSTDFKCNFKVAGAEECFITRYAAGKKPIVSWEALMLTTEDFETARKKFKTLYSQLNNLTLAGSKLKGTYEAPAEGTDFTTVVFSFDPKEESTKKLRVELIMEAQMMDWKVKILVYDRDRNDDERGTIVED
jgi:hypothetical protein